MMTFLLRMTDIIAQRGAERATPNAQKARKK